MIQPKVPPQTLMLNAPRPILSLIPIDTSTSQVLFWIGAPITMALSFWKVRGGRSISASTFL